jgi:hypothetical protein
MVPHCTHHPVATHSRLNVISALARGPGSVAAEVRVARRRRGQVQHHLTRPRVCSPEAAGSVLLVELGGAIGDLLGAAEPAALMTVARAAGWCLPVRAGSIGSARAAAFARCDLGGDHPPGDRLAVRQLPDPWRGPDDHTEPAAADVPAVDAHLDPSELSAARQPQILLIHDASDGSQVGRAPASRRAAIRTSAGVKTLTTTA